MKLYVALLSLFTLLAGCGGINNSNENSPSGSQVPQYGIEAFMNSPSIRGGAFSPDGTKMIYSSDKSGIFNIYETVIKTGETKQVTKSTDESIFSISYFPEDDRILYRSDKGGNEIYHLYVGSPEGTMTEVTPWKGAIASFESWSDDLKSFYVSSNKRDPKYMDLWQFDTQTLSPKMVYKNDKGYSVGAISPAGNFLAMTKVITTTHSHIILVNTKTGSFRNLTQTLGNSKNTPSAFSKDGKFLYFLSDAKSEFTALKKVDLNSGKIQDVYSTNWDVMAFRISQNGLYEAILTNNDAQTDLQLRNTKSGKEVKLPQFKDAYIGGIRISRSEDRVALFVTNSKAPTELFVFDIGTGEKYLIAGNTDSEINPEHLVEGRVIRYKSFDGQEIPAIYYEPKQASSQNPVPAVVWVHGGPGGQSRVSYFPLIQYLVNHGYAVCAVNNRGSSGYGKTFNQQDDRAHGEGDLQDCIYAKRFLGATSKIDTNKVAIVGGSYGGFMVLAALAFEPEAFEAGVDIFGVSNWLRTLRSMPPWWESFRNALIKEMGDPEADSLMLKRISPLFHADKIKRPLMVVQGANDPRVLKVESDEIVAAVKAQGVPVEYLLFPDEGHGFVKKENQIKAYEEIKIFLDTYLKGAKVEEPTAK